MTTVVLAQADSVATWLGVAGQWAGALGTVAAVVVALRLARWERRRDTAERRDRETAQARLVTISVESKSRRVDITNHSEQPVHQPRVQSMGNPQPSVGYAAPFRIVEVLAPHAAHGVYFAYNARTIEKPVNVDDVTITFTDAAGLRWRRTGNGEPVRILKPAPEAE